MTTLKTSPCYRDPDYLAWIRTQQCALVRFQKCHGDVVAHHVRLGQNGGTGMKPSDYRCIPLCDHHHRELHDGGEKWFEPAIPHWEKYEPYIEELLQEYFARKIDGYKSELILAYEERLQRLRAGW